jgi:hypothetical protein
MGFFNKLKQGFSQLTGGNGNLQMQLDKQQVERGGSVNISLTLNATGELKAKSVGVEITGTETVKMQVPVAAVTTSGTSSGTFPSEQQTEEQTQDSQTYTNQQILDGAAFQMNVGESKQYTGVVQIPQGVQPTYKGVNAIHIWKIRAYADVPMGADISAESEIIVL